MTTVAEIVILLLFATVAMHLTLGTWMVWGIMRQLREREVYHPYQERLTPPLDGTLHIADGTEVEIKIMGRRRGVDVTTHDDSERQWKEEV